MRFFIDGTSLRYPILKECCKVSGGKRRIMPKNVQKNISSKKTSTKTIELKQKCANNKEKEAANGNRGEQTCEIYKWNKSQVQVMSFYLCSRCIQYDQ